MTNIAFYTILTPEQVLGSSAVAVTFAEKSFGWFAWTIPGKNQEHSGIVYYLFIYSFFYAFFCSICGTVHFRGCEWYSVNFIATILRWCLRGTDARNPNHDPDPTIYSNSGCLDYGPAVHAVSYRFGYFCTDQLRWICHLGKINGKIFCLI